MKDDPWTMPEQIENAVLPALFDLYENGNDHGIDFDSKGTITVEEKPVLDAWIGNALANGWIEHVVRAGVPIPHLYRLTAAGYRHFKPKMDLWRAFQK